MKAMCGLSLAMAAGCLTSGVAMGAETPEKMVSNRTMKAWPVANIYYNVKTGERIAMPIDARPRNVSAPVWVNANSDPCGTGGTVGIIDNPDADGDGLGDIVFTTPTDCTAMPTVPCEGSWNLWWGDICNDTVVDCVVLAYGIIAPDTDTDGDSIGDGIEGYDLFITWSDNDPGVNQDLIGTISARSCIFDLGLTTLPGALPGLPPGYVAVYTLTLDFASTAPSLIFELGDSDNVDDSGTGLSGAALYPGTVTGLDRDGDDLADFSWAYRFDQSALPVPGAGPGATKGANGYLTVAPGAGCTVAPCADPTDPTGVADAIDVYTSGPSCPPTITSYVGTFFFGGFSCGTGTPYASSYLEMYGSNDCSDGCADQPGDRCNDADLAAPAGTLNFDDVVAFLTFFGGESCAADLADPIGTWNFDDVVAFLTIFGAGCP